MGTAVIAVTAGEPAGVGPDLCVTLAQRTPDCCIVYIGDRAVLDARAQKLGLRFAATPWPGRQPDARPGIYLLSVGTPRPVHPGKLDVGNSPYVVATLQTAVDGCLAREFDALVTGPVHKAAINEAGIHFTGHTEFIGEHCASQPVMMLACPGLRVALATTHVPLAEVSRHLSRDRLAQVIRTLHRDLHDKFHIDDPAIAVCGLNPHAGEGGHLGREENEIIQPVLNELRRDGMRLQGPVPADTAFVPSHLAGVDAVLAMYHDQGLPVIKYRDFARTVNVTLGLPFVRTSPDHGTALELAGTGRADPTSMHAAFDMARRMCP